MNTHAQDCNSLKALFDFGVSDPAIDLLARTTAVMRADPDYLRRDEDVVGAVFLTEESPASLSDEALARTLSRIADNAALDRRTAERIGARSARLSELAALPSPLRECALDALKRRRWTFGGFGIRRLALLAGDKTLAELLRVEPGRGAADHDHADDEFTLVVTGAYRDSQGLYRPGDIALARPGFNHSPRTEPGEICYLLAVTYGQPKFSGYFGLLQRVLGFPWSPKIVHRQ